MPAPKRKKRNPQDATRRNVQAANKRFKALYAVVDSMDKRLIKVEGALMLSQDFATAQRSLGYVSSTAPQHRIIVDRKP